MLFQSFYSYFRFIHFLFIPFYFYICTPFVHIISDIVTLFLPFLLLFILISVIPHLSNLFINSHPYFLFNPYFAIFLSTRSPRIYAGCFGCQIVAHALNGSVDLNPTKRFVLKAETVQVVDKFKEHLLLDCCSSNCCPAISRTPAEQQEDQVFESVDRSAALHYITKECCQTAILSNEGSLSAVEDVSQAERSLSEPICDVSEIRSEILQISFGQKANIKSQIIDSIDSFHCKEEPSDLCDIIDNNNVEAEKTQCRTEQSNSANEYENDSNKEKINDSPTLGTLKLIVSHGDCVCILPPESVLLGSSQTCTNEMYLTGKFRNIFACQSHPEFEYEYCIKDRIWPAVTETRKRLNDEEMKSAAESFDNFSREDSKCLLKMIRSFLQLPCTLCTTYH